MDINLMLLMFIGFVLLGLLIIGFTLIREKSGQGTPNYRALFIMGAVWFPVGLTLENPGLWGLGAVLFLVGLANKSKWQEEKGWSDLSPVQKKFKLVAIGVLSVLFLGGVAAYFLVQYQ